MTVPKYIITKLYFGKNDDVTPIIITKEMFAAEEGLVPVDEHTDFIDHDDEVECTNCGFFFDKEEYGDYPLEFKYCPECGAKVGRVRNGFWATLDDDDDL